MPKDLKEMAREQWTKVEKGQLTVPIPLAILFRVALAGGVLAIALTVPNLLKVLEPLLKTRHRKNFYPSGIRDRLTSLTDQNLITIKERRDKTVITLTDRGKKRVLNYSLGDLRIKPQSKWDGKWRIVVFDIPEKKRSARDIFRRKLKELEFVEFQKSVWAHKYPCLREVALLVHLYKIRPYVTCFEGALPAL